MPVTEISPEEAARLIKENSVRLIDCREEDEFAICKLPGAELLPLSIFGFEATERLKDKDERILIYCHHGMRSMTAAQYLDKRGYNNVASLAGGIDAYARVIDSSLPRY